MKKALTYGLIVILAGLIVAVNLSCTGSNDTADSGKGDSYLSVISILDEDGEKPIMSDVYHHEDGAVYNDPIEVTAEVKMKNPDTQPGQYNDIKLNSFRISYVRDDGNNEPGVDVPYPIEGDIGRTIEAGGEESFIIDGVRHQAKLEPPLIGLRNSTDIIYANLVLEIYGEDLSGEDVYVKDSVAIEFGDFADQ